MPKNGISDRQAWSLWTRRINDVQRNPIYHEKEASNFHVQQSVLLAISRQYFFTLILGVRS